MPFGYFLFAGSEGGEVKSRGCSKPAMASGFFYVAARARRAKFGKYGAAPAPRNHPKRDIFLRVTNLRVPSPPTQKMSALGGEGG